MTQPLSSPTPQAERARLIDRVRTALPVSAPLREVTMFGGVSFMVEDAMVVAAQRGGDLLVRIEPARHVELTGLPGARPAEMGTGRAMGPGWVSVQRDAIADDAQLQFWIDVALDFHARRSTDVGG